MADEILRIIPLKNTGEATVVSLRLSKELLKDIDFVATETGHN